MNDGPLIAIVAVLGVAAVYLLMKQTPPATTAPVDACGGSAGARAVGAVDAGLVTAFTRGVGRVTPDQACSLSSTILAHSPSTAVVQAIAPIVSGTVGSVSALLHGNNSFGPPLNQLDCATLRRNCQTEITSGGISGNGVNMSGNGPYCSMARSKGCM